MEETNSMAPIQSPGILTEISDESEQETLGFVQHDKPPPDLDVNGIDVSTDVSQVFIDANLINQKRVEHTTIGENIVQSTETSLKNEIDTDDTSHTSSNIYILSSAGKPIFSWKGDEQELSTLTGLIQAVISICKDAGDTIQTIISGTKKFVFLLKEDLYFLAVSSQGETELFLHLQLEYLYHQILFILTSKFHKVMQTNPKYDLRSLLGGMHGTMHALLEDLSLDGRMLSSAVVASALPTGAHDVLADRICKHQPDNLLYGILFHNGQLAAIVQPKDEHLQIHCSDLLLLSNFVKTQTSFERNESWTPICLPRLQAEGFLQAYIADLTDIIVKPQPSFTNPVQPSSLYLLLLSTGNTPEHFHSLKECRNQIQQELKSDSVMHFLRRLDSSCSKTTATKMAKCVDALHFLFTFQSQVHSFRQSISSEFHASLSEIVLQQRSWNMYQHILLFNHQLGEDVPLNKNDKDVIFDHFERMVEGKCIYFHVIGPFLYIGVSKDDFELFATFSSRLPPEEVALKCQELYQLLITSRRKNGIELYIQDQKYWQK